MQTEENVGPQMYI